MRKLYRKINHLVMAQLYNPNKKILVCVFLICFSAVMCLDSYTAFADVGNNVKRGSSNASSSKSHTNNYWSIINLILTFIRHPILFIILIIVLEIAYYFREKIKNFIASIKSATPKKEETPQVNNGLDKLRDIDSGFSETQMISKVQNIYIQLQNAWQKKDWKQVRPFETDELFNEHKRLLDEYISKRQTNVVENVNFMNTNIVRFQLDGPLQVLDVKIKTRMNDYIIDDRTKEVVVGSKTEDIYTTYIYRFVRPKDGVTKQSDQDGKVTACPNCGADVSINQSGECEYCGSVISNGDYGWVLANISTLDEGKPNSSGFDMRDLF